VGTLFLGAATFGATRSANRAARVAERSLLLGLRPVLTPSRPEDPDVDVIFGDGEAFHIRSGSGLAERRGEVIYLAIPLRNVGTGLAVLQAYDLIAMDPVQRAQQTFEAGRIARSELPPRPVGEFRLQQRDFYIASGDTGFWQAALRDPADEQHVAVSRELERSEGLSIDILYGDHEGGQQTVSRFNLVPGEDGWFTTDSFHWVLGAADPRESA
jgi:hypothetical protein